MLVFKTAVSDKNQNRCFFYKERSLLEMVETGKTPFVKIEVRPASCTDNKGRS